jgi:hypothetical protein
MAKSGLRLASKASWAAGRSWTLGAGTAEEGAVEEGAVDGEVSEL